MITFGWNWQYRQRECDKIPKVPIPRVRILYVCILWIFPIKNVAYPALRQFHFHGDFQGQSLHFCSLVVRKNTDNYLAEKTSKWERMRTTVSDLPGARLGFCLNNLSFVSNICTKLFGNISAETFSSMTSSLSTDYSRNDSRTDVIETEGGCTTNYAFHNDADDNVQPYE